MRLVVESDRPWLAIYPREGTLASGESVQIRIRVFSVGMVPETYRGEPVIQKITGDMPGMGLAETIDITFVAVPDHTVSLGETRQLESG